MTRRFTVIDIRLQDYKVRGEKGLGTFCKVEESIPHQARRQNDGCGD